MRWLIVLVLLAGAAPAWPHDMAAWTDPARDDWYRSLKDQNNVSCCDLTDGSQINPEKVRQRGAVWFVDIGKGFVPVPPERVIKAPVSIDGMPYIFMMMTPTVDSPNGIRCFVPPVGTY